MPLICTRGPNESNFRIWLVGQSKAYGWWKLVLKRPRFSDPMPWDFFIQEFWAKYVTDMYKEAK